MTTASSPVTRFVGFSGRTTLRFHDNHRPCSLTASAYPRFHNQLNNDSPRSKHVKEVSKSTRRLFVREVSTQSKDGDISIAKVLLYVAAEDEAFFAFNREMDARAFQNEWDIFQHQADPSGTDSEEQEHVQDPSETDTEKPLLLGGKSIPEWLSEIDAIAKEVEAQLATLDVGRSSFQVLKALDVVLFDLRGFKRATVEMATDPEYIYLHSLLKHRCGSAFLFSIIGIEVCQLLGVPIVGSQAGRDFSRLDTVTNRDIISVALNNLLRVYWRRASKDRLMLTSPLSDVNNAGVSELPLLRPEDIRLAIAAAERMLLLDPGRQNWRVRRDLGLLFYYLRQYREAIRELSVCIAFSPVEDEEELKIFVMELHRIRGECGGQ